MARPIKAGTDYFPLNVYMDDSIELIEAEFGLEGFAIVVKLWQKIYAERGYYCEWNDEVALLFAKKIGAGGNVVSEIVNAAIRRGIFNDELFGRFGILTSSGIQKRYFEITSRRTKVDVDKRYLLVVAPENAVFVTETGVCVDKNKSLCVQKSHKVKESKEKEIKEIYSSDFSDEHAKKDRTDYKSIIERFNSVCNSLPRVTKLSDARKTKIRTFLKEFTVDELYTVFAKAQQSDFLSGRSGRWSATFDWLINKTNAVKVLDGNYDNKGKTAAPAQFVTGDLPWGPGGVNYE